MRAYLVKSLKHKRVHAPTKHPTDSILPVLSRVLGGWDRGLEVLATRGPVGLPDPERHVDNTLGILHVL